MALQIIFRLPKNNYAERLIDDNAVKSFNSLATNLRSVLYNKIIFKSIINF